MRFCYAFGFVPAVLTHMAFAQCPIEPPNPTADSAIAFPFTTAQAFAAIDAQHVAEGLWAGFPATSSMIETYLPATYSTLNPDQKIMALINAERIIRRIPPIFNQGVNNTDTSLNDPFIGNITANHSLLIAINAGWWNLPISIIHSNAVDGTPSSRETAPLGPPGLVSFGAAEIAAVDYTPEGAVFEWMYTDSSSNWGHRDAIVNCAYTLMGGGVASTPANVATWGPGAMAFTVDFITPLANSTYVATLQPPPAPCPPVPIPPNPAPTTWTCPVVAPPDFFSELPQTMTLSADGSMINIQANISVDPFNGAPNQVQTLLVFQLATWGMPNGGIATLGIPPQGQGAFSCPLTPVQHAALDTGDPAAADPNAVTFRCAASIPFFGNPVIISVTDTFNNLAYGVMNLTH